jgi:hypothetical protein
MHTESVRRVLVLSFISLAMTIGLTGCFKGNISVDVKANGSGVVSIAAGMTQQAKALASSNGTNPLRDIEQSMSDGTGSDPDIKVTKWMEGDYEWVKAEKEFKNLDEINRIVMDRTLFNHFSLTRKPGLFRNEFTLDAELDALNSELTSANAYDIDPAAFIEMGFSVKLPGEILESNGFADLNDPNRITWNMESYQPVSIRARSIAWNWTNIVVILGGLGLMAMLAVIGFGFYMYDQSRKNRQRPNIQVTPLIDKPLPHKKDVLVDLGIERLLTLINANVLNSSGQIHKKQGEIALGWKNQQGEQKFIDVKELGNNQISINGEAYSATREDTKSGLISALQEQKG